MSTNAANGPANAASVAVEIGVKAKKEADFSIWYKEVLEKSEMLSYSGISGCYVLRPWSYNIWEKIQEFLNGHFKVLGVQNASFPMFIAKRDLELEKEHIEGFSPEVAWVTKTGKNDLEDHLAIRPTSETAMYGFYSSWIRSHRDLPLKLNQWNNVVRWEFKNPLPFIRAREFLWQEGHTAHLTKEEADVEVRQILDHYQQVYKDLLAVPVIPGIKSEKEKFAGALYTTTVEGFIPSTGRCIQAATSHCLGQNFSRMFNITVQNAREEKSYVWQNSWGFSTRSIGIMVMTHGDDKGLVLPPRVASVQVIIVPCGVNRKMTDEKKTEIYSACENLERRLKNGGVRCEADLTDGHTPGFKFNHWELKGVPLRLELGPRDLERQTVELVRRDNGTRRTIPLAETTNIISALLETMQKDMLLQATQKLNSSIVEVTRWEDFVSALNGKKIVAIPWCEVETCEDDIRERSARSSEPVDEREPFAGAKSLTIPFDQTKWAPIAPGKTKCPACGTDAKRWTLFGRSY